MHIKDRLNKINDKEFVSNSHTSQHRIFGFITTNIRSINTFIDYINKIVPEYISRKNNLAEWKKWCYSQEIATKYKHAFLRLEVANILFRNIEQSPTLNNIAEKMYEILKSEEYGRKYLFFLLHLYLLNGSYFGIQNQPQVEIEKIINSFKGNIIDEGLDCILNKNINRFLLATIFYNPSSQESYDIAFDLLGDNITATEINNLIEIYKSKDKLIYQKVHNAGGQGNFEKDVAVILNYYILKNIFKKNMYLTNIDILNLYVEEMFKLKLNEFFDINDKNKLTKLLQENIKMLEDIFVLFTGMQKTKIIEVKNRKNLSNKIKEQYNYKCFFDVYECSEDSHKAHELNYFHTKENNNYLEAHHMIQLKNSKHFGNSLDVVENLIPVCPNCHRKLHFANTETLINMIKIFYKNMNKKEFIRKGIFVDINTLLRFYGIEEEIEEEIK